MKSGLYVKLKKIINDLLYDTIGGVLYAMGIYTFARLSDFAPGGISGLSLIINHVSGFPIGLATLLLNLPLIFISLKFLGKRFLFKSFRSMLICSFFIDIVFPRLPAYSGSPLMAAIYYGVFAGAGMTCFYLHGSSSGGTDFVTLSIRSVKPHLSIGNLTMIMDLIIIITGGFVFGDVDAVLYGILSTFVTSAVIDKLMYRLDAGTLAVIITNAGGDVAKNIDEVIKRGSTIIKAHGSYTGTDRDVLLCACSNSQAYILRRAVFEADDRAFVMFAETSQVFGEGFKA